MRRCLSRLVLVLVVLLLISCDRDVPFCSVLSPSERSGVMESCVPMRRATGAFSYKPQLFERATLSACGVSEKRRRIPSPFPVHALAAVDSAEEPAPQISGSAPAFSLKSPSPLSPLAEYLYSAEGSEAGVPLSTLPRGVTSSMQGSSDGVRRRVVAATAEELQADGAAASEVDASSSFFASLPGRYVVLARTPLRSTRAIPPATHSLSEKSMHGNASSSDWLAQGRQCDVVEGLGYDSRRIAELATARKPRVFPEEALRRSASRHTAFFAPPPRATGEPTPLFSEVLKSGGAAPSRRTRVSSPGVLSAFSTALPASPPLEIHVVDETHILVYLPPSEDASTSSASSASLSLLQSLSLEENDGGDAWRIWDVFASDRGVRLKLSPTLRAAVADTEQERPPVGLTEAASPSWSTGEAVPSTYEVTLWTARGMALVVRDALEHAPRLARFLCRREGNICRSKRISRCELTFGFVDDVLDAVQLRIDSTMASSDADEGQAERSQYDPRGWRPTGMPQSFPSMHQPQSTSSRRACVREVLLAVAAHPAVRWVEESLRHPETLNALVSSVLQYGSCSSYVLNTSDDVIHRDGALAPQTLPHPFWDLGWNGTGEVIAVADSGVDTSSCFFRDDKEAVAMYPSINTRHRKVLSYFPYKQPGQPPDAGDSVSGHGTHVAATAAGYSPPSEDGNPFTMTRYNGVAIGAKIFVRDLASGNAPSLILPPNILDLFTAARDVGAHISTNSWGFATDANTYLAIEKVIDTFVAAQRDMLVVVASGNRPDRGLYAPGRAKNVLTVGSHVNSVEGKLQETVSPYSSFGPTYDGRCKPDLLGPGGGLGTKVISAKATATRGCSIMGMEGTSMATAAVSGAAALVRQYLREHWKIANPSAALLRAALIHSTSRTNPFLSAQSGFGRLDLSLLLPHANHTRVATLAPIQHWFLDDATVKDEEVSQFCFKLQLPEKGSPLHRSSGDAKDCGYAASTTVTATVVWSDPGTALEGSTRSQVHDLDVMLVTRNGKTYYSSPDGKRDSNNTVEQVRVTLAGGINGTDFTLDEWAAGFRVLVRGAEVRNPAGQLYALVVSGPGLLPVASCGDLFTQWRTSGDPKKSFTGEGDGAFCPMNCTQHGKCARDSLLCACDAQYASVDCSECNSDVVCHGHGSCAAPAMTCTCDPRGHFLDARCSTCAAGWYGPLCASDCTCLHGGNCDRESGLCACPQDTKPGGSCFQGSKCQYCCEGYTGAQCDQRSYWCDVKGSPVLVDDPNGGYIQVNGYETYPNSVTCRWTLRAEVGQQIQLEVVAYDIEKYDMLYVYDVSEAKSSGGSEAWGHLLLNLTGTRPTASEPLVLTSSGEQMNVEFISDWDGTAPGFLLFYRFTSCDGRCRDANRTGRVGHWRCGDSIGLPVQYCLCQPPFVGWHCDWNASEVMGLSKELRAAHISSNRVWEDGALAWMMPRSALTVAELRLSAVLASPQSSDWERWRRSSGVASMITAPLRGATAVPLVVHGLTELYLPLLSLPTPAVMSTGKTCPEEGVQEIIAHLKLTLELKVNREWMDQYAKTLSISLGVSVATETATPINQSYQGNAFVPAHIPGIAHGAEAGTRPAAVGADKTRYRTSPTHAPLSFDGFTFTPIALSELYYCADIPVAEVTVPLRSVGDPEAVGASASSESYWTTRVIFSLFWGASSLLEVANESWLNAVVVAQHVTLTRTRRSCPDRPDEKLSTLSPAAGATVAGVPLSIECHGVARVPALIAQRLVERHQRNAPEPRHLSWRVVVLVEGIAAGLGIVVGVLRGVLAMCSTWKRRHTTYAVVQNAEELHEMPPAAPQT